MTDSSTGGYLLPASPSPPDQGADLDKVFHDLFVGLTSLAGDMVRPRWVAVPAKVPPDPATNWLSFGVSKQIKDAGPYLRHQSSGGVGNTTFIRHEEVIVEVTCYGSDSQRIAGQLRDMIEVPQNLEAVGVDAHLLAYVDGSDVVAAPDLVNQQWVKRFDMTLRFRRVIRRTLAILDLASVQLTTSFTAGPNGDPTSSTINVTP